MTKVMSGHATCMSKFHACPKLRHAWNACRNDLWSDTPAHCCRQRGGLNRQSRNHRPPILFCEYFSIFWVNLVSKTVKHFKEQSKNTVLRKKSKNWRKTDHRLFVQVAILGPQIGQNRCPKNESKHCVSKTYCFGSMYNNFRSQATEKHEIWDRFWGHFVVLF